jgi:hypothetical protein
VVAASGPGDTRKTRTGAPCVGLFLSPQGQHVAGWRLIDVAFTSESASGRDLARARIPSSLIFHGPLATEMDTQMRIIADGASRWVVVLWAAAAALSLFAVAGFVVLAAASHLTQGAWTTTAWAVLPVGALWTLTTAVAEATVVAGAAVSGNTAMFEAWWAFSEGKATGFIFLALAVAVIACNETRTPRATPVWASWWPSPPGSPRSWAGSWGSGSRSRRATSSGWFPRS